MIQTIIDRYIDTIISYARAGNVVMINVGLTQARPNNENKAKHFCMHCAPHVLTWLLSLCCFFFSLKAFETLAREIIKAHHLTATDVKTTEVHTIHHYYITCTSGI